MLDTWGFSVNRWHQSPWPALRNSGDNNDAHSARVARLILHFWPGARKELLAAALCHDLHEGGPGGVGDLASPSKAATYGAEYRKAATRLDEERGTIFRLTITEAAQLKFADKLDAYRWAALCEPRAIATPEWEATLSWLKSQAAVLGVSDKTATMLGYRRHQPLRKEPA